jgi:hypothetical protein
MFVADERIPPCHDRETAHGLDLILANMPIVTNPCIAGFGMFGHADKLQFPLQDWPGCSIPDI